MQSLAQTPQTFPKTKPPISPFTRALTLFLPAFGWNIPTFFHRDLQPPRIQHIPYPVLLDNTCYWATATAILLWLLLYKKLPRISGILALLFCDTLISVVRVYAEHLLKTPW